MGYTDFKAHVKALDFKATLVRYSILGFIPKLAHYSILGYVDNLVRRRGVVYDELLGLMLRTSV